ncbi:MAG: SGNH/GDSL hydrolase family protein [Acutalibacteraceae bacterium]
MATIQELKTQIENVNVLGRTTLAYSGVEVDENATTYEIMKTMEDVMSKGNTNVLNSTFKTVKSTNLINPELITTGYLGTNCVLKTNTGCITDFIKVEPNTTYTGANFGTSGTWSSWFFESDDLTTCISIIGASTFTTPENCNYVRLVYTSDIAKTSMLVKGETYPPTYIDYTEDYFVLKDDVSARAIEPFMKKYNNQFWNYDFGRCTVNTTTHRIEKATNGSMVGSGLFRIFPNVIYHTGGISLPHCYLYDENVNFISTMEAGDVVISGVDTTVFTITNPNVAYAIFTAAYSSYDENNAFIKVYNANDKYVDVNDDLLNSIGNNINALCTKGKKWACLGDSITYGYSLANANESRYTTLVSKECGVVSYNYGFSGSRITAAGDETTTTYTRSMVIRYESMIDDADIITVFGGINDANNNLPLGEFGDTDIYTFYGALDTLINGLQSKYAGKPIGFITPLNYGENAQHEKYVNAILDICGKYAIPVLDMYHEGLISTRTDALSALYFADGLHPNELGHQVMARKIANFLNRL